MAIAPNSTNIYSRRVGGTLLVRYFETMVENMINWLNLTIRYANSEAFTATLRQDAFHYEELCDRGNTYHLSPYALLLKPTGDSEKNEENNDDDDDDDEPSRKIAKRSTEEQVRKIVSYDPVEFATDETVIRTTLSGLSDSITREQSDRLYEELSNHAFYIDNTAVVGSLAKRLVSLYRHIRRVSPAILADFVVLFFVDTCHRLLEWENTMRDDVDLYEPTGWCSAMVASFLDRCAIEMAFASLIHQWILFNCSRLTYNDADVLRERVRDLFDRQRDCPHLKVALSCFASNDSIMRWEDTELRLLAESYSNRVVNILGCNRHVYLVNLYLNTTAQSYQRRAMHFVNASRAPGNSINDESSIKRYAEACRTLESPILRGTVGDATLLLKRSVRRYATETLEMNASPGTPGQPKKLVRLTTETLLRENGYTLVGATIPSYFVETRDILRGWMRGYARSVVCERDLLSQYLGDIFQM